MKKIYLLTITILYTGLFHPLNAQTLVSHNFDNGSLGGWEVCTTQSPNYVSVINNRIKTKWYESSYNGTRMTKGAEACNFSFETFKEGWYGMNLTLGSDYPTNKEASIAQAMGHGSCLSWEAMLKIVNGNLAIEHRGGCGASTSATFYNNLPKAQEIPIIMHFVFSASGKGKIQIWVDGVSRYVKNNINLGILPFNGNDVQTAYTGFKLGQYNYDNSNYTNNETRTVYYDDVTWYNGPNGYSIVDPSGGSSSGSSFKLVKRNASGFAMDGGSGGADGQSIELYSNVNHHNLTWVEINRGGGYYSYQKLNTNYCIDGGNGGANGQDVYLWSCDADNQNQHWQKIDAGNGHYRLQKRNAPGYSIDGGNGGGINQNVYLWASKENEQNQQWRFDNISNARVGLEEESNDTVNRLIDGDLLAYPNPSFDQLTINLNSRSNAQFVIIDNIGYPVLSGDIDYGTANVDIRDLKSGIYTLKITNETGVKTQKIFKK